MHCERLMQAQGAEAAWSHGAYAWPHLALQCPWAEHCLLCDLLLTLAVAAHGCCWRDPHVHQHWKAGHLQAVT